MARRSFKRTDRLAKQVGEVVAVALRRETREESLFAVVVTGCEVTRDLSFATVHYYLPDSADREAVSAALQRASGFLRRRVGQEVRARNTPQLRFLYDNSVDHARLIESILSDIGPLPQELEEAEAAEASEDVSSDVAPESAAVEVASDDVKPEGEVAPKADAISAEPTE